MKRTVAICLMFFSTLACGPFNLFRGYVERNRYNGKIWYASQVFVDEQARFLAIAAARGDAEKIGWLISQGANANYRGNDGITPLLWAIYAENKVGFETLLEHGADPYAIANPGSGVMNIIRYASENEDDWFFLEVLLKYGVDPNYVIPNIDKPLIHNVCDHGPMERLRMVVEAGADVNKRTDARQMTPLMTCALFLQYDKALFLIERGAGYDTDLVDVVNRSFRDYVEAFPPNPKFREQHRAYRDIIAILAKRGIRVKERKALSQIRLVIP